MQCASLLFPFGSKRDIKVIDERHWNQNHSWNYVLVCEVWNKTYRVEIRRHEFNDESYARVKFWNQEWKDVHSIPIVQCSCCRIAGSGMEGGRELFEKDAEKLLCIANSIT
jgi:hypothetical protein